MSNEFWFGVAAGMVGLGLLLVLGVIVSSALRARRKARSAAPEPAQEALDRAGEENSSEPAPEAAEAPLRPAPQDLRFGRAELVIYRESEYVEALRCSPGIRCGGRELTEGEPYWAVPVSERDFLVVCGYCIVVPPAPEGDPVTDAFEEVPRGA